MDSVIVHAYAKINLFLEVKDRLENGYHNLESVMQSVSLEDIIEIRKTDDGDISLSCTLDTLPTDETNLVVKASNAFFEAVGIKNPGLHFNIEKHIPVGAGLAGGSADAAATLIGLDKLYDTKLGVSELCRIGKTVGADVPFCIKKGTCLAEGIGERLLRLSPLPPYTVLIALGEERISTKWAFEQLDAQPDRVIKDIDGFLEALKSNSIEIISNSMYNVFETVSPHKQRIKEIISKYNEYKSLMSGSGPSIFSLFDDEKRAYDAEKALKAEGYETFVCRVLNIE